MRLMARWTMVAVATASLAMSAGCAKTLSGVIVVVPDFGSATRSKSFVLPRITFQAGKDSYWVFTNLHAGAATEKDVVRVIAADDVFETRSLVGGFAGCEADKYTAQRAVLTRPLPPGTPGYVAARGETAPSPAPAAASPTAADTIPLPKCTDANPPNTFKLNVNRAVELVGTDGVGVFTPGVCVAKVRLKPLPANTVKQVRFRVCIGEREVEDPVIIIRGRA